MIYKKIDALKKNATPEQLEALKSLETAWMCSDFYGEFVYGEPTVNEIRFWTAECQELGLDV